MAPMRLAETFLDSDKMFHRTMIPITMIHIATGMSLLSRGQSVRNVESLSFTSE
ncbi:MAG: hypothetical protein ACSHX3_00780 [Litorimonas sp.]